MRLLCGESRLTRGLVPGMISSSPPVDILFEDETTRSSGRRMLFSVMSIVVHFVSLAHAICK
jgi:hypothetical protein